jgi:hypothetical protein
VVSGIGDRLGCGAGFGGQVVEVGEFATAASGVGCVGGELFGLGAFVGGVLAGLVGQAGGSEAGGGQGDVEADPRVTRPLGLVRRVGSGGLGGFGVRRIAGFARRRCLSWVEL